MVLCLAVFEGTRVKNFTYEETIGLSVITEVNINHPKVADIEENTKIFLVVILIDKVKNLELNRGII